MLRFPLRSAVLATGLSMAVVAAAPLAPAHASGTSAITGSVWNDANRNGLPDSGEAPFANEGIWVYDSTGTWVAGGTTDATGRYQIGGLADGTYTVAFDHPSWSALYLSYVPDTTGSLYFQQTVTLAGSAVANFGLRQIVRSTSPITSATTPQGTVVNSYDDVVTAQSIADDLASGALHGAEAPLTTVYFDLQSGSSYSGATGGSKSVYVAYADWVTRQDFTLFYEYAHAWSSYYAYVVQQDPTYSSYLKARGLYGNPNLGSSLAWEPVELIADDYRELFGSASAASYAQDNTSIPLASQVPGLQTFLSTTFMQPPTTTSSSTVPAAPTSLTATPGNAQVALSWPGVTGATGYTVLRCTGTGCQPTSALASSTSASFTDNAVANFTSYTYAVEATNSAGTSAPSSAVTATPTTTVSVSGLAMNPQPVVSTGTLSFTLSTSASVTVTITAPNGKTATLLSASGESAGTQTVTWSAPKKATAATYTATVSATDAGGHTSSAQLAFAVN